MVSTTRINMHNKMNWKNLGWKLVVETIAKNVEILNLRVHKGIGLTGSQEVTGSSPVCSTTQNPWKFNTPRVFAVVGNP